jgi:hypothetical protein
MHAPLFVFLKLIRLGTHRKGCCAREQCPLWAKSGHWSAVCLKQDHEARVLADCLACACVLLTSLPDAVRRSANATRIVSAIGLNENQCGKERTSAGAPSSCTCSLRRASASVERPSQTRQKAQMSAETIRSISNPGFFRQTEAAKFELRTTRRWGMRSQSTRRRIHQRRTIGSSSSGRGSSEVMTRISAMGQ